MKKWVAYVLGVISGMILTLFLAFFWGMSDTSDTPQQVTNERKMFDEPGECVSRKNFEVQRVLESGDAIALEISDQLSGLVITSDLEVLIQAQKGSNFYDNQIIKTPKGKCARQVGTYTYKKYGDTKVIPIVSFE